MSIDLPTRIVVLVAALIATAAAAFALLVLGHSKSAAATTKTPTTNTHRRTTAAHVKARLHRTATKPRLLAGLPAPVAQALAKHPVVVVGLYERRTGDGVALAEARAGAAQAHTTFVALDVLRASHAGSIAGLTGSLADPGIVIVRRPGTVVRRLDGYQDRQVVAQAAHDAR